MEFAGEGVKSLSMDDRLCVANMAIEAGAKNGIFPVDSVTEEYMTGRARGEWTVYEADEDAEYAKVIDIDLSLLKPTVSFPHLPENTKTIDEVGSYRPVESENQVTLDDAKVKAWISKGVVVTPTVKSLLNGKGISLDRKQG